MPSFSACAPANEGDIAKLFHPSATGFKFPDPGLVPKPNRKQLGGVPTDDFKSVIGQIQSRWNLDRSESARRVYLDAFLHEAVRKATFNSIVTVEDSVAAGAFNGMIDYIVSAIDAQTRMPIYRPSLVFEAKKKMETTAAVDGYRWQLLAEIGALRAAKPVGGGDFCCGALSDGRYWCFFSVGTVLQQGNKLLVQSSKLYDTAADGSGAGDVLCVLAYWLEHYTASNDSLFC